MAGILVRYLIFFMPLIVTLSGWATAYRRRHTEPLHPLANTLLAVVTALATVAAATFLYFTLRPALLPAFESPDVSLFLWFLVLGPICAAVSFLVGLRAPEWLAWVLGVASFWLTGLGVLAALAFWHSF